MKAFRPSVTVNSLKGSENEINLSLFLSVWGLKSGSELASTGLCVDPVSR